MIFSIVGQLILGWLLADFFSGAFHWWEDRVGDRTWPVIGPLIIEPNRHHHVDPIARDNFGDARNNVIAWAASAVAGVLLFNYFGFSPFVFSALAGGAIINYVHGWAHNPKRANALIRVLWETGVIQSPAHHAAHHRGKHDRRYCILTNWLNPVLDGFGLWAAVEGGMTFIGLEPNRGL